MANFAQLCMGISLSVLLLSSVVELSSKHVQSDDSVVTKRTSPRKLFMLETLLQEERELEAKFRQHEREKYAKDANLPSADVNLSIKSYRTSASSSKSENEALARHVNTEPNGSLRRSPINVIGTDHATDERPPRQPQSPMPVRERGEKVSKGQDAQSSTEPRKDVYRRITLPQQNNKELHDAELNLPGDITARVKVLNHSPLIFEVENFIDEEEAEMLIDLAKAKKMLPVNNRFPDVEFKNPELTFKEWDYNEDGFITTDEIALLPGLSDINFSLEDASDLMFLLKMDKNEDDKVDLEELKGTNFSLARSRLQALKETKNRSRNITSQAAWLWHDQDELLKFEEEGYFVGFHARISQLTGIPSEIIQESEPIQVQHFAEGQFQLTRLDSEPPLKDTPCCLFGDYGQVCRLCRYLSYSIFLNDVADGGELAFPLANHEFQDIMGNSGEWRGYYIYSHTTGSKNYFKVNMSFLQEGANRMIQAEGADEHGGFFLINSIIIDDTIKFEKAYKVESKDAFQVKYSGKIIEGTKISGNWWVPGERRMRGTFFMWSKQYEMFSRRAIDGSYRSDLCSKARLVIKPKRGKAVFWYNHHREPKSGMVGDINQEAMSASCEVKAGEKWIASSWINIIGDGDLELRAWRTGKNWMGSKEKYANIFNKLGTDTQRKDFEDFEREFLSLDQDNKGNRTITDDSSRSYYKYKPESNALKALKSLLDGLSHEQLRIVASTVHKKLSITCIPLTVEQDGRIKIVDGSRA